MVRAIPAGETDNNGIRDKLNDCAQTEYTMGHEYESGHEGGHSKALRRPKLAIMAMTITMNAPVGPPICTEHPPAADTMKPPIMAVMRPYCGLTPLAVPKAMATNATMPTMIPAPQGRS